MSAPSLTLAQVKALDPCEPALRRVEALLDPARSYTAAEARAAGCTFGDLVWIASRAAQDDADAARRVRHWVADCAERVLPIYERDYPNDSRPRDAIKAARDYADGLIGDAARDAAWAAAWAARAAGDAARAAAWAAGDAGAAAWAAAWDARDAARDHERAWQFDRLIYWLSDEAPAKPTGDA